MTETTNLPAFATAMAAVPKRLRNGLHAAQHGRENTMLITSEEDPKLFVGRLTKTARRRYRFEVFAAACTEDGAEDAKVVAEGRVTTPLKGITEARSHHAFLQAR